MHAGTPKVIHILYVGLGLTQQLEEMVDLNLKTAFDSRSVDEKAVTPALWNYYSYL